MLPQSPRFALVAYVRGYRNEIVEGYLTEVHMHVGVPTWFGL